MKNESAKKLLAFMKKSPTRYQVVEAGARGQILCFAQRIEHNGVPHPRRTHRGLYAFRRP